MPTNVAELYAEVRALARLERLRAPELRPQAAQVGTLRATCTPAPMGHARSHDRPGARLALLALLALLPGCRGKLLGTAALQGPGTASTTITLGAKSPRLWADTDGSWRGPKGSKMQLDYEIDLVRGGAVIGHTRCSTAARGSSICGVHSTVGGKHDADCELELSCQLPSLPPGELELRVTGTKGANVLEVRKMSLNVREP
jgi:hypothetical protein